MDAQREGSRWWVTVEGPPEAVLARLRAGCHPVSGTGPSGGAAVAAWRDDPSPLFLEETGESLVIGPRLGSRVAARYYPVLRAGVKDAGAGKARLEGEVVTRLAPKLEAVAWTLLLVAGAWLWPVTQAGAGGVLLGFVGLATVMRGWLSGRQDLEASLAPDGALARIATGPAPSGS